VKNAARKEAVLNYLGEHPEDTFYNYALALEYISEGDTTAAFEQLRKVKQLDEQYLPVYYQLGQICANVGRNEEAIAFYQMGVRIAQEQKNTKTLMELRSAIRALEDEQED
jgi:Tfp pilus assembly protein PilF